MFLLRLLLKNAFRHKLRTGLTLIGLVVAICCLFPFNFMVAQLKRRTTELEQAAHHFELAYNTGLAKPAAPPL